MNTNDFINAVNDHLDILEKEDGGKQTPDVKPLDIPAKTPIDENLDIKDILTDFVGKGDKLSHADQGSLYARLKTIVGEEKATKLLQHVYIFNQSDDAKSKKNTDEKVEAFYNTTSHDKDVSDTISKIKNIGGSPVYSLHNEPDLLNQQLSGKDIGKESKVDETKKIAQVAATATS